MLCPNGLFPLPEMDSESDSKPYHYNVLCRNCSTGRVRIQVPIQMVLQIVTVPILGMDLCPRDRSPSQFYYISIRGSESESEPVEKSCIVQVSDSESVSGNGNKPLEER